MLHNMPESMIIKPPADIPLSSFFRKRNVSRIKISVSIKNNMA
jgi:hypothetical protein